MEVETRPTTKREPARTVPHHVLEPHAPEHALNHGLSHDNVINRGPKRSRGEKREQSRDETPLAPFLVTIACRTHSIRDPSRL